MTETPSQTDNTGTPAIVAQPRSLYLISLLLVGVVTFLFYFSLTGIPLQGIDLDLFALPRYLSLPTAMSLLQDSTLQEPVAKWLQFSIWSLSDGSSGALRSLSLLLHVSAVLFFFGLIRRWTGKQESVVAPLLGALLYCVLPTVPALLATANGFSELSGCAFALIAANSYMAVTDNPERPRFVHFTVALVFSLLAAASFYSLILLPLLLLLLDGTRLEKDRETRLSPDWAVFFVVTCAIAIVFFIIVLSDAFTLPPLQIPYHLVGMILLLLLVRLMLRSRISLVKNALLIVMNLLLIVFGVLAFQQTMGFWEPLTALENGDVPDKSNRLALQYAALANSEAIPAEQQELLRQAALLWKHNPPGLEKDGLYKLAYARMLEDSDNEEEARTVYEELRRAFPFDSVGIEAAAGITRVLPDEDASSQMADLLGALSKRRVLSADESWRYAISLMRIGDVREAARFFSRMDAGAGDSFEAQVKEQSLQHYAAVEALKQESQQKIEENATSMVGFVSLAESELLSGNLTRAFYWLEFALRREPAVPKAWQLLGVLAAMTGQQESFVRQWGALQAEQSQPWLELAHKAMYAQAEDAMYLYLKQTEGKVEVSVEEMMAVLYLEQRAVDRAERWLLKAVELMPHAFRPRLLLSDLFAAMQNQEAARQWLEEARVREAPAEEIQRRLDRLDGKVPDDVPELLRPAPAPGAAAGRAAPADTAPAPSSRMIIE